METLVGAGLCAKARDGVKILGAGEITAAVQIEAALASKTAIAAVEAAGGSLKVLREPKAKGEEAA